jgi:hypothetical protein
MYKIKENRRVKNQINHKKRGRKGSTVTRRKMMKIKMIMTPNFSQTS